MDRGRTELFRLGMKERFGRAAFGVSVEDRLWGVRGKEGSFHLYCGRPHISIALISFKRQGWGRE